MAATLGDEEKVLEWIKANPSLANKADVCHRRPLSGAVSGGHKKIVQLLLEHKANPNAKEAICQGGLSLRTAAGMGDLEIVRLLLEYRAIPEHWVDSSGDAMYAAYAGGHQRIVQTLYSHGGSMELQIYAAYHRIDVIAEVLRLQPSKADDVLPYSWENNGSEELAYDIMRLAIHYGARFEQASEWKLRWTVLKYPSVFQLLQKYGAKPELPLLGIAGDMSRRYKNEAEQCQAILFLIEQCGAKVNCQDEEGFTPLAKAVAGGHAEIVQLLLSKGSEINTDAPEWAQPLHLAEEGGNAEMIKLLHQQ